MPIRIYPAYRIIPHIPIQIQRLRIIQLGIRYRLFLRAPVRAQPPPHSTVEIPGPEVVIPGFGIMLLAGKVVLSGVGGADRHGHSAQGHRRWRQLLPKRQAPIPRGTRPGRIHLYPLGAQPVRQGKVRIGTIIGCIRVDASEGPGKINGEDLDGGGEQGQRRSKGRSRFPAGMTNKKATAKATARTEADSLRE